MSEVASGAALPLVDLNRNVQRCASRRGAAVDAGGRGAAAELKELLLQGTVGLLRSGDVAGLEGLPQAGEERRDGALLVR